VVSSSLPASENLHNNGHNRPLFDQLVGTAAQGERYGDAKRLGSPEVDDPFDLPGPLPPGGTLRAEALPSEGSIVTKA
jgi:hypothetical protein